MLSQRFEALNPIINHKYKSINGLSVRIPTHLEEKVSIGLLQGGGGRTSQFTL